MSTLPLTAEIKVTVSDLLLTLSDYVDMDTARVITKNLYNNQTPNKVDIYSGNIVFVPVGETFSLEHCNNKLFTCEEHEIVGRSKGCKECCFYGRVRICDTFCCDAEFRKDNKNVIFKLKNI